MKLVSVAEALYDATEHFAANVEQIANRVAFAREALDDAARELAQVVTLNGVDRVSFPIGAARSAVIDVEVALMACLVVIHERNAANLERATPEKKLVDTLEEMRGKLPKVDG